MWAVHVLLEHGPSAKRVLHTPKVLVFLQTLRVKQQQGGNAGIAILQHLRQPAHGPEIIWLKLEGNLENGGCAHSLSLPREH